MAHSIARMKVESGDTPFDVKLVMIHLWVRTDAGWKLAAHQTTPLGR